MISMKYTPLLHAIHRMLIKLNPNQNMNVMIQKNEAKYHQNCKIALAIEILKGHACDLLQIYLMMSKVHFQKVDGTLLKTTE